MTDAVESAEIAAPDANATTPEVESVAESSPATEEPSEKEPEAKPPKGVQKRLDELTRNWREAERREAALLEILKQRGIQPEAPKPQAEEKLKTLADFEYDEARYQAYLVEVAARKATEEAKRALKEEQEQETKRQKFASFRAREADFAKSVEDYREAVESLSIEITREISEAIVESEDGPALLYHLAKNRDIAAKIAQLPPIAAVRELGRIEARLAFEREQAKAAKVSKAPPPPPKVEGSSDALAGVKASDPESDKLPMREWLKRRDKEIQRKR